MEAFILSVEAIEVLPAFLATAFKEHKCGEAFLEHCTCVSEIAFVAGAPGAFEDESYGSSFACGVDFHYSYYRVVIEVYAAVSGCPYSDRECPLAFFSGPRRTEAWLWRKPDVECPAAGINLCLNVAALAAPYGGEDACPPRTGLRKCECVV